MFVGFIGAIGFWPLVIFLSLSYLEASSYSSLSLTNSLYLSLADSSQLRSPNHLRDLEYYTKLKGGEGVGSSQPNTRAIYRDLDRVLVLQTVYFPVVSTANH
jgi:hypothetical protein